MDRLAPLRGEAFGIEQLRLVPQRAVAVENPGRDDDLRARPHRRAAQLVRARRLAAQKRRGRIEPHRLVNHLAQIDEAVDVGGGRRPPAQHALKLLAHPRLRPREGGEQIERPAERVRRRFVARPDEGDGVVDHLLLVHRAAVLRIARRQQHGEQIVGRGRRVAGHQRPALGDDAPDLALKEAQRRTRPQAAQRRHPFGQVEDGRHVEPADRIEIEAERLAHAARVDARVAAEDGARQHLVGEAHHLGGDVALGLALGLPARDHLGRRLDHRRREADDPLVLEGGRGGAALPAPRFALGGQQRVAERRLQPPLLLHALGVVGDVVEQDALHRFRLGDDPHIGPERAPPEDRLAIDGLVEGRNQIDPRPVDEPDHVLEAGLDDRRERLRRRRTERIAAWRFCGAGLVHGGTIRA